MRKLLIIFLLPAVIACVEEEVIPTDALSFTIKNTEIFEYSLGNFGFEEGAFIVLEPKNAKSGEVKRVSAEIQYYCTQKKILKRDKLYQK